MVAYALIVQALLLGAFDGGALARGGDSGAFSILCSSGGVPFSQPRSPTGHDTHDGMCCTACTDGGMPLATGPQGTLTAMRFGILLAVLPQDASTGMLQASHLRPPSRAPPVAA